MPINKKYLEPFEMEGIYHIYNKTNNDELLFREETNYIHFLNLYAKYIAPFADTYAWSLLPNHFHFLIKVKSDFLIVRYINDLGPSKQTKTEKGFLISKNIDTLIEMTFKRFFTAYAMGFNSMFGRRGNLFYRTFKRVKIARDNQFTQALIYIHTNAQKHKLVQRFTEYRWTSYHSIVSDKPTLILRDEVIDWFGNKNEFVKAQIALSDYYYIFIYSIEEI